MFKPLDRSSDEPLYLQIRNQIFDLIRSGDLPSGARLPSERELARRLNVNRSTVSSAYKELVAEGLVEGQVGRGTVVCAAPFHPTSHGRFNSRPLPWLDYFASLGSRSQIPLLRDAIPWENRKDFIYFTNALPDLALHPVARFAQAAEKVLRRAGAAAFRFDSLEGNQVFRELLTRHARQRSIEADVENVLVLNGVQQGLDLLARTLLIPGDAVLVAAPSYVGALGAFRVAGARLITVPMDEEGMRVDEVARMVRRYWPRFIYTVPTYQNPTGRLMSLERRHRLLALAQRHQIPIVEDDPYSDLYYDTPPPPSLKALDEGGHVIYLSTFSKVLFPGLRLGWLVAPQPVVQRLAAVRQFVDMQSNTLFQLATAEFIRQGWLADHLALLREEYGARYQTAVSALHQHLPPELASWNRPQGGYFIWVRLKQGLRAQAVQKEAMHHHLLCLTGDLFFAQPGGEEAIRLNFTHQSAALTAEGIHRLGQALRALR